MICGACGHEVIVELYWKNFYPASLYFECKGCRLSGYADLTPRGQGVENPDQMSVLGECENCGEKGRVIGGTASCRECGHIPEDHRDKPEGSA